MGRGIAQVAAAGGFAVNLFDSRPGACDEAIAFTSGMLARQVEKGRIDAAAAESAKARLKSVPDPADFASCDLVVEAIVEDLSAKQALFRQLEEIALDTTILATNTSSLSVTEIAAVCRAPERSPGLHFFNPVPLMDLVEVVSGLRTAGWVVDTLLDVAGRMGKKAVRVEDTPASWSTMSGAATARRRCASCRRASPARPRSTGSCAPPAFAWARSAP